MYKGRVSQWTPRNFAQMTVDAERGRYTPPEGSRIWEYLTIFVSTIMALCVGSVMGWNSPSIMKLMAPDSPIPITASEASTLVATVSIGYAVASPLSTLVINRIGRKRTSIFSALPMIISWGMVMIATNVWILYAARFIAGVSVGLFTCVFPMYMGEIALPSSRGAGVALHLIMFHLGILVAFAIVPYLSILTTAGVYLAMVVGFAIAFCYMLDSPYYLVMRGRMNEAEETLQKLRGKMDVSEEMDIIQASVRFNREQDKRRSGGMRELLTVRGNRHAFIIINLLVFAQHFCGYSPMLLYCQLIFKSADSVISENTATISIGVVQLFSMMIITVVVDRIGRKPLLVSSGFVLTAANLAIGIFFYAKDYLDADVSAYSWTPFVAAMWLMFAFNCGPLSLALIMMSELLATEIKALATCLVGIIGGCFAVAAAKIYILVAITWGYGHSPLFVAFAVIMVICTVVTHRLLPETKGKTFVQIQKELND